MDWSYIAGFFDGEGSLTISGKTHRITIPQTNELVLNSIQNFVGRGSVFPVKKRKIHWKDSWIYCITKQEDVLYFLSNIESFLIVKKELVAQRMPIIKKMVQEYGRKKKLSIKLREDAVKLRQQGLTYRQIGRKLSIDWGYARRVIVGKKL